MFLGGKSDQTSSFENIIAFVFLNKDQFLSEFRPWNIHNAESLHFGVISRELGTEW